MLLSLSYRLGGYIFLSAVFAALWTTGVMLASRRNESLVLVAGAVSILGFAGVRASAIAFLFFIILEKLLDSKQERKVWHIPLLFVVWANMHGSFPLGFAVLAYAAFIRKSRVLWIISALSVAASFINPYGYNVYIEIARTVFSSSLHGRVTEWKSFVIPSYYFFTLIPLLGALFAYKKRLPWKDLAIPSMLALMGISATRYFLFFTASIIRFLEGPIGDMRKKLGSKFGRNATLYTYAYMLILICAIGASTRVSVVTEYPWGALGHIDRSPDSKNIFNHYDYGGFLIWQIPEKKVYIDGRMPSWKHNGRDYMDLYYKTIIDPEFRKAEFKRHNIGYVLFPKKEAVFIKNLVGEGWKVAVEDMDSVLLIREK